MRVMKAAGVAVAACALLWCGWYTVALLMQCSCWLLVWHTVMIHVVLLSRVLYMHVPLFDGHGWTKVTACV